MTATIIQFPVAKLTPAQAPRAKTLQEQEAEQDQKAGAYAVEEAKASKAATPKPKKAGKTLAPVELEKGFVAIVTPKKCIQITGERKRYNPREQTEHTVKFDRTFEIGDRVEYDSWNLSYIGTIVAISAKTVTVDKDHNNGSVKRMKLQDFADRNWNFDLAEKTAANSHDSRCL